MESLHIGAILMAAVASFFLSASAGFGGSLVLVPVLVLGIGAKEGVALAALLLGANNLVKAVAYRRSLPFASAMPVVVLISLGAFAGARVLVAAPESLIVGGVLAALVLTFIAEWVGAKRLLSAGPPILGLASGATSGLAGISGPLKGLAIRSLGLDRAHTVGAASLASLAGDVTKAGVFFGAGLLGRDALLLAAPAIPLMVVATLAGRKLNREVGERGYAALFWGVMVVYTARMIV